MYVPAEHSTSIDNTPGSGPSDTVERVDRDRARLAFDLDALAGQFVQSFAVDPDRRHHRRDLLDVARQVLGDDPPGLLDRDAAMSWVAVTSPAASSVDVSVPSTTSPV